MVKQIDEMKIKYLDPKVRALWAFNGVVLAFLMWLLVSWLSQLAFPDGILEVNSQFYPFMFLMIIGIVLIPYLVWIELKYRTYTYYLAETEIIIRSGVLRIERITIPFEKVQNVNVSRSILERILGLATIKIETAGTIPTEAEGLIPGVGSYRDVVDEILEHMKHTHAAELRVHEETVVPETTKALEEELAALKDEIRRLREENAKLLAKEAPPQALEFEGEKYKKPQEKTITPQKKKKKKED